MIYKKNVPIKVFYVALHRTTGLTNLDMSVYDEVGGLSTTVTLTEIVGSGGGYYGSFTPDAKGQWRIRIQATGSGSNGDDIQKVFDVGNSDVDTLDTKIDVIDSNVDLIKTETDKIPAIKTETDKIPAIKTETDKIPAIKTETDKIQTIDNNVDAIKTKTDNLPTDTAAELSDIKDTLSDIDDQISTGGYIMN
jgi:tetrahydromethanopterin S-methyltransferase subunit G